MQSRSSNKRTSKQPARCGDAAHQVELSCRREKTVNDSEVSGPWKDAGLVKVTQKLHNGLPEYNTKLQSVNKSGDLPISHNFNLSRIY